MASDKNSGENASGLTPVSGRSNSSPLPAELTRVFASLESLRRPSNAPVSSVKQYGRVIGDDALPVLNLPENAVISTSYGLKFNKQQAYESIDISNRIQALSLRLSKVNLETLSGHVSDVRIYIDPDLGFPGVIVRKKSDIPGGTDATVTYTGGVEGVRRVAVNCMVPVECIIAGESYVFMLTHGSPNVAGESASDLFMFLATLPATEKKFSLDIGEYTDKGSNIRAALRGVTVSFLVNGETVTKSWKSNAGKKG